MSKRCKLQKEYYKEFGNYKGIGKYSDHYVKWLEDEVLALRLYSVSVSLPSDPMVLAKYLHDNYEQIAKRTNWETQKNCKVEFEDLPIENKNTMILLAGKLILDFISNER